MVGARPRARWGMIALCFTATAINYIDRANLSAAVPSIQSDLGIDPSTMGIVLSGFFYSYAIMQLPSGWLIDRFGVKPMYAVAVAWWSVFTMATALGRGAVSMFGARLLLGVGEAGAYPSNAKVTALWFARSERAFASSIFDSGSRVGTALSLPIVTWLIATFGWRESFIVTGLLGFVWVVAWLVLYRNPRADEAPHDVDDRAPADEAAAVKQVRWLDLFGYRTVWGMMIGFFCLNFVIYFFITWFPSYLVHARGFSMPKVGTLGTLPALFAIPGGWLGGVTSDWLYRRGWSLTAARKTCLVGGMIGSSSIAFAAFVPSVEAALALFSLSYACLAFTGANIWSLPSDVAPTKSHVASIAGIQNFASNLAGVLTTTFTGVMVQITGGSFEIPLLVGGGMCLLGAACYLFIVGPIERLPIRHHAEERLR
jgi:D-galactonate transporter